MVLRKGEGQRDIEAVYWLNVGQAGASDDSILELARKNGYAIFTLDMDFATILMLSGATVPSVVQIRHKQPLPEIIGARVIQALRKFKDRIENGAVVTIAKTKARIRDIDPDWHVEN